MSATGTDKERFLSLLKDFGLGAQIREPDEAPVLTGRAPVGQNVNLAAGYGGVEGYQSFIAVWAFDDDGKFISVTLVE